MLKTVCPKLPMRDKNKTLAYYNSIGFKVIGNYDGYLMVAKDDVEIHFFEHQTLNPLENDGQVYIRINGIESFYHELLENTISIHPNGTLQQKSWGQKEFSLLDPDYNLLTFGEAL